MDRFPLIVPCKSICKKLLLASVDSFSLFFFLNFRAQKLVRQLPHIVPTCDPIWGRDPLVGNHWLSAYQSTAYQCFKFSSLHYFCTLYYFSRPIANGYFSDKRLFQSVTAFFLCFEGVFLHCSFLHSPLGPA